MKLRCALVIAGLISGIVATELVGADCGVGKAIFDRDRSLPWCPFAPGGVCPSTWSSGSTWRMSVPAGCDRVFVKMWGTGGGGDLVSIDPNNGPSGGAGYADAEFSVGPSSSALGGRFVQGGTPNRLAGETTTLEGCFQLCQPPYSDALRGNNHRITNVWSAAGGGGNGGGGASPTCLIGGQHYTCLIDGGAGGAGGRAGTAAMLRPGCPCTLPDLFNTPGQGGTDSAPGAGGTGSASGDCPDGDPEGIGGGSSGNTQPCSHGGDGWWGGGAGGTATAGVSAGGGGGGSGPSAFGPNYRFSMADGNGRAPARESDPDRTAVPPGSNPVDPGRGALPGRRETVGLGRVVVYWFKDVDVADDSPCTNTYMPADFSPVEPCRLADTRILQGAVPITNGQRRRVQVRGLCGVPNDATAVALQVTAIPRFGNGHLSVLPGCRSASPTSIINFQQGAVRINNAILPVHPINGHVVVDAGLSENGWLDFTIDVTGYFLP